MEEFFSSGPVISTKTCVEKLMQLVQWVCDRLRCSQIKMFFQLFGALRSKIFGSEFVKSSFPDSQKIILHQHLEIWIWKSGIWKSGSGNLNREIWIWKFGYGNLDFWRQSSDGHRSENFIHCKKLHFRYSDEIYLNYKKFLLEWFFSSKGPSTSIETWVK